MQLVEEKEEEEDLPLPQKSLWLGPDVPVLRRAVGMAVMRAVALAFAARSVAYMPLPRVRMLSRMHSAPRSEYERMTVPQLKELLRSKALRVGGKKAELVDRLVGALGDAAPSLAPAFDRCLLIEACKS